MADDPKRAFGLSNLSDVVISAPVSDGEAIKYNSTTNTWTNQADAGSATYAGLTDVELTGLSDGNMTYYDATAQKWKNTGNIRKENNTVVIKDNAGIWDIQPPNTTADDEFVLKQTPQVILDKTLGGVTRINDTAGVNGVILNSDNATAVRTQTFPDANGEFILTTGAQTLTDKTLDSTTKYNNSTDTYHAVMPATSGNDEIVTTTAPQTLAKKIMGVNTKFASVGSGGNWVFAPDNITADQTFRIRPIISPDWLVWENTPQTLQNKDLTSISNTFPPAKNVYCMLYTNTPGPTTSVSNTTPSQMVAGVNAGISQSTTFPGQFATTATDGEFKYTGTTRFFKLSWEVALQSGTNNRQYELFVRRNGVVGAVRHLVGTDSNGIAESNTFVEILRINTNDIVSLWIQDLGPSASNVTIMKHTLTVTNVS